MKVDLKGRVAFVTGAARGNGQAIADLPVQSLWVDGAGFDGGLLSDF